MDYQDFISQSKSLLIAPAGYGKTFAIAECIKLCPDNEKKLILTHTHAGIASLKGKFKLQNVSSNKYHIETITGFIQKYVLAFYCGNDLPQQEDKDYFDKIQTIALDLFKLNAVKRIIKNSYNGLFVDEYQDCSKVQHQFIMLLADVLPAHILGDPMQGIFGFRDELIDFSTDLVGFGNIYKLEMPWRWNANGNNKELGEALHNIRAVLESPQKKILLNAYNNAIHYFKISENDIYQHESDYYKFVCQIIINKKQLPELNSLLIIVPPIYYNEVGVPKGTIVDRCKFKARLDYTHQLILLEAFDEPDYYEVAKNIDDIVQNIGRKRLKIKTIKEKIVLKLFNKTDVKYWFNEDSLIKKKRDNLQYYNKLNSLIDSFLQEPSIKSLLTFILYLKNELHFKTMRKELLNSILKSMQTAIDKNITVFEAMALQKNLLRHIGRKIYGKCLGTTLLTKGLEFDTVVILDAHRFNNYKDLYVAMTRACKKLIIFSETDTLNY